MPVRKQRWRRDRRRGQGWAAALVLAGPGLLTAGAALVMIGCASPGPPRAPSLQLPAPVSDLVATRRGDAVELQFAVPTRTSDGMAYRAASMRATVCRAVEAGSCVPVGALSGVPVPSGVPVSAPASGAAGANRAALRDALPAAFAAGPVRLLTYRVELTNPVGRTAGFGDAAYAAAGAAPADVTGLRAEGSRAGVVVRWQPAAAGRPVAAGSGGRANGQGYERGNDPGTNQESDVVLRRERVSGSGASTDDGKRKQSRATNGSAKPGETRGEAGVVLLSTRPLGDPLQTNRPEAQETVEAGERLAAAGANGVVDDSAAMGSTYRYAAERQHTVQLGGHTLVLHSGLSAPVEVALRAVYPPPAPTDLVGTVFPLATVDDPASVGAQEPRLAVDLIWTPADDAGTIGYLVFREPLDASGKPMGERMRLTAAPVRMPAFHDVLPASLTGGSAKGAGSQRLRYSVVAVDAGRMESAPITTVVETSGP